MRNLPPRVLHGLGSYRRPCKRNTCLAQADKEKGSQEGATVPTHKPAFALRPKPAFSQQDALRWMAVYDQPGISPHQTIPAWSCRSIGTAANCSYAPFFISSPSTIGMPEKYFTPVARRRRVTARLGTGFNAGLVRMMPAVPGPDDRLHDDHSEIVLYDSADWLRRQFLRRDPPTRLADIV